MGITPCHRLFLLMFSDNLYGQIIFCLLLHRQSDVRALLKFSAFPNVSVHVIDVIVGFLNDHRVLLSFERPSIAVLLLSVL